MLKTISKHIKDLLFIKQILYGFPGWIVVRNLDDIYVHIYLSDYNINKYVVTESFIGKNIHDVCDKSVAKYYKSCGENAVNSDKIFISKKVYTTLGKEYEGLLYFCPYKDKQNNIIGCASYNIEIDYLKRTANMLFKHGSNINDQNHDVNRLYYNLITYKELFDEIIKIINKIDPHQIIRNNNIILIEHLKTTLNILLNNLKNVSKHFSV